MQKTLSADIDLTKRQAHALARRLRKALVLHSKTASGVLLDLPPADIAVLETFAHITNKRSKEYVNAV